jgi:uncharacterized membrane protein
MNLIYLIKNNKSIKNLYKKEQKRRLRIVNLYNLYNGKESNVFGAITALMFAMLSYLSYKSFWIENYSYSDYILLILITTILSIIFSAILTSFLFIIYTSIKTKGDNSEAYGVNIKKYNNVYKLHKRINKKRTEEEKLYIKDFNFNKSSEESFYYLAFINYLHETKLTEILNNKELIIKDIKESFKIENQKKLLKKLTDFIKSNQIDKELLELEETIENKTSEVNILRNKSIKEI